MRGTPHLSHPTQHILPRRVLAGWIQLGVNLLLIGLLGVATAWRESPEFWLHSGGYPVLLRDCVFYGFYPLFATTWTLGITGALNVLRCRQAGSKAARWALGFVLLQLVLLAFLSVWAFGNNFTNLLEGRPLHWRPW